MRLHQHLRSLYVPQNVEPQEAEAIVAAVVELGAVEKEVDRLIEVGRERQRALKQLDAVNDNMERLRSSILSFTASSCFKAL